MYANNQPPSYIPPHITQHTLSNRSSNPFLQIPYLLTGILNLGLGLKSLLLPRLLMRMEFICRCLCWEWNLSRSSC